MPSDDKNQAEPFLEEVKKIIADKLDQKKPVFSYPPNPELGDLSLACFESAKEAGKNPTALAASWAETINQDDGLKSLVASAKSVGPYLNIYFTNDALATGVISRIKKEKGLYGNNTSGAGQRIMVEYSNGNTHKEYHVGHLRNIAYGDAVSRILDANGYISVRVSYINDFGIHTAKTIWNWKMNPAYTNQPEPKGYLLGKCYAEASQKLVERPEYKLEVAKIMQDIESRRGENYSLWKETRDWSIDYFASIYEELDINFVRTFYESDVIDEGLVMVKSLLEKGILKESEGAIIADLQEYDLGVLPVVRSDGTALYPVADLALAVNKFSLYDLVESIYVVDIRQSQYFKQLFKVLELLGYQQKLVHLPYDFVTLPDGMMSSRTGNVITYRELRDKVRARLIKETKAKREDWSEEEIVQTAEKLSLAVIKFEMLKVSADKIMIFNLEEALKFEGYTACYLEYTYARLQSVLRKEGSNYFMGRVDLSLLTEPKEKELLLKLARYPESVLSANEKKNPGEVARYLFELAQVANDYYHAVNILKAEKKIKKARLALVRATVQVLANGFNLLGVPALEEM